MPAMHLPGEVTIVKADCSPLLKWALRILKIFLFLCYGFAIACLLSALFGASHLIELILPLLTQLFSRLAILTFTFLATAIVLESLR